MPDDLPHLTTAVASLDDRHAAGIRLPENGLTWTAWKRLQAAGQAAPAEGSAKPHRRQELPFYVENGIVHVMPPTIPRLPSRPCRPWQWPSRGLALVLRFLRRAR